MNKVIEAEIEVDGSGAIAPTPPGGQSQALTMANLLTYARIAAVPLIVICFFIDLAAARWTALALFVIAAITDYLDGYIARTWDQRSALGKMLDPIADKLLVAAVLVMLASDGTIAGATLVIAVIILAREILVSGLREFLAAVDVDVPVSRLAKWKTATQLVALGLLLAGDAGEAIIPGILAAGTATLWIAAVLTVATGYDYMKAGIARLIAEDGA